MSDFSGIAADHPASFYGFDWRQPVNQWLALSLIGLMCLWVLIYYVVHKADAVTAVYAAPYLTSLPAVPGSE